MNIKYTIIDANLDTGVVEIDVDPVSKPAFRMTLSVSSVAVSDGDTVLQLHAAIEQMVQSYYNNLFPKPPIKPVALLELVGKKNELSVC